MAVVEYATIVAREGVGDDLEGRMPAAVAELAQAPGHRATDAHRCIERPDEIMLAVEWDSVEAHLDYRETEGFARFRATFADLLSSPPSFAHYRAIGA